MQQCCTWNACIHLISPHASRRALKIGAKGKPPSFCLLAPPRTAGFNATVQLAAASLQPAASLMHSQMAMRIAASTATLRERCLRLVAGSKALHATAFAHLQAVVEALKLVALAKVEAVLDRPQSCASTPSHSASNVD